MNRSIPWLQDWLPRILILTFFWDLVAPLISVPAFSILKLLFYVLVLIQLPHFVFGRGRFFGSITDPYPLCGLLIFIIVTFVAGTFPKDQTLPGLANEPFLTVLFMPQIYAFLLALIMFGVVLLLALRPSLFRYDFFLIVLVVVASLVTISIVLPSLNWNSLSAFQFSANLPFPLHLFCLFLYLLALPIYDDAFKFQRIADFAFAADFLVLYLVMNGADIHAAVIEIAQFQATIGTIGSVLMGILSIASAIYTFAAFDRRRTRTTP